MNGKAKKYIKVSVFLDNEMANFIDDSMTYGMRRSDYMRSLVWEKMKRKRPKPSQPSDDPFANPVINGRLIPDDLKDNAHLICEWWPIRYKKKATCSTKVAERIFDKLRTFTLKDRKIALERAISGGWMDIWEVKQSKIAEEPKNNHPQNRIFTAKGGFE